MENKTYHRIRVSFYTALGIVAAIWGYINGVWYVSVAGLLIIIIGIFCAMRKKK